MYSDRVRTLSKAYRAAERANKTYTDFSEQQALEEQQLTFLIGMQNQLSLLDKAITEKESEWRKSVLSVLETEIITDLSYVFPDDGYNVKLVPRVLRGKIHIVATVSSTFSGELPGKIRGTQGRFFQQVVSLAALVGVMDLLGIKTVYIDEAFSGASKRNIKKLNSLLSSLQQRGFNIVMIAQDASMADGISANRLFLQRSLDNKTSILQEEGGNIEFNKQYCSNQPRRCP